MRISLSEKKPADLNHEDIGFFYQRLTIKIFMALGFPLLACFFGIHLVRGNYIESTILFLILATVLVTFFLLHGNGGSFIKTAWPIFSYRFMGLLLAILFIYTVAVEQNFSNLHWCYLFPIFVAFALGAEEGFVWVILFFCAIAFAVYTSNFNFVTSETALDHKVRFLLSFFMVSVILLIISLIRHRNLKELYERQRALVKSEECNKKALDQNKALLREVHHRVKNNLQVISSLLYLQSGQINSTEAKEVIGETRNRVFSMAMVYEMVYRSEDFSRVDMGMYAKNLFVYLLSAYNKKDFVVRMSVDAKGIYLGLDSAIPCCLILQELISNAIKHAFTGKKEGEIRFSLKKSGKDKYKMKIKDNGIGISKDIDFQKPETLGLHLVSSLVTQLSGSFAVTKNNGTSISIKFPSFSNPKKTDKNT